MNEGSSILTHFIPLSTVVLNQPEKKILIRKRRAPFGGGASFPMVVFQSPQMAPHHLYKSPTSFTPLAQLRCNGVFFCKPRPVHAVIALWLWLEQTGYSDNLVTNVLALPGFMLNAIVDETVTCLNCIDDPKPVPLPSSDANLIPLLQCLTKGAISLQFFQENRIAVIKGVAKLVDEVCTRAFQDILQQTFQNNAGNGVAREGIYGTPAHVGNLFSLMMMDPVRPPPSPLYYSGVEPSPIDVSAAEERPVPPDERTIFLTFSKGYPISENEVKDFFTIKYGDFIEAIHMQEVNEVTEQPLYARLVTRSPSSIEVVLEGKRKAKFSINGKHVWARKFFRKSSGSPRKSSSPPSSQPTSPPATQD
ncbi:hypothetical protein CK203_107903 [Vitis vinifera]|uniref:Uncharacterized protein n=1 Tax=Vitis vinifera TaxID=29760 RepID=A0A438E0F8_VITVI|nr:hypothetical protein CK203_107903 [Vitis vinifera]